MRCERLIDLLTKISIEMRTRSMTVMTFQLSGYGLAPRGAAASRGPRPAAFDSVSSFNQILGKQLFAPGGRLYEVCLASAEWLDRALESDL